MGSIFRKAMRLAVRALPVQLQTESAAAMSVILQQKLLSAVFYRIIIRLQMHGVPKLQRHGSFVRPTPGSMHKPSKAAGVLIKTRVMSAPLVH